MHELCKLCEHKRVDVERGIVCELTNENPNYEGTCPSFKARVNSSEAYSHSKTGFEAITSEYKSSSRASWFAIGGVGLFLLIKLISYTLVMRLYQIVDNETDFDFEQYNSVLNAINTLDKISIGSFLLAAILYIVWFRKAYLNASRHFVELRQDTGWTIAGWLVPIAQLFIPYRMMRNMWVATHEATGGKTIGEFQNYSKNLVTAWWLAYVTMSILGRIVMRMEDIGLGLLGTSEIIGFLAGALVISMTYRFNKMETYLDANGTHADEIDEISGVGEIKVTP